jgi:hypothetical protein
MEEPDRYHNENCSPGSNIAVVPSTVGNAQHIFFLFRDLKKESLWIELRVRCMKHVI